ncbi:hypothetical protein LPJ66_001977 [Kickxella alabastrina]|uniref:Uncharacterized protein n=1 Tax=Kickxella alabastrina TaxID=61397 RepID=A0ACC1IRP3_9FUNG|nr:hypothetical protein LPJ66_001977 [Kickxella alabastrina]
MASERRILVVPKEQSSKSLQQLRLSHPRTGILSSYYADVQNEALLEAATIDMKGKRSWLGDGWVLSNGSASILTPVDPLFLYLALITKFSKAGEGEWKFVDIDSLQLESHEQMDAASLIVFFGMKSVQSRALVTLCEVKAISSDIQVVKIDNSKVINWLKRKCDASRFPKSLEGVVSSAAAGEELVRQAKVREMALLVSEYLPQYWANRLFAEFSGFAEVSENEQLLSKRVQAVVFDDPTSYTMGVASPQASKAKPVKPKSVKEKQLEKAAKKSKPITSFFQKKV